LLKKLQQQIVTKKMKVNSKESYEQCEDMQIIQPNKNTKQNLNKKFNEYFEKFETPQTNKAKSRVRFSASVVKNKESMIKPFANVMNSANPKYKMQKCNIVGFRNGSNQSSSLQRNIKNINLGDSNQVTNIRGFRNLNKNKIKDEYTRIGKGFNFKQSKRSNKNGKATDIKRKKRSMGSDASGSQKRRLYGYGYGGCIGTTKTNSKSKVSDNLGNFSHSSNSMIPQYPIKKQCKAKDAKHKISRNSLQTRKNNYNPMKTPIKHQKFINPINSCKPAKKTTRVPQKTISTFNNIWSLYTSKELKRFQKVRDTNVNSKLCAIFLNNILNIFYSKKITKDQVQNHQ
jgi:hypothetical protein